MMAMVWVLWTERNNRIFNHKALFTNDLLDSIIFFVDYWARHLGLPLKRKVDASILILERHEKIKMLVLLV